MRLLYATATKFPSRQANRLQTFAMARALGAFLGDKFYFGSLALNGLDLKGVQHTVFPKSKSFILGFHYARFIKKNRITHLHCREHILLFFILLYNLLIFRQRPEVTYECHKIHDHDILFNIVLRWCSKIIVLTKYTKKILKDRGVKHIEIIPDAVDIELFRIDESRKQCRLNLGLDVDEKIVLYSGQLFAWKGVDTLAQAARYLDPAIKVVIVGGAEPHIKKFCETYGTQSNIEIVGYRPQSEIPKWLKAADLVVLPTSAKTDIGNLHTSPLKLFEYMASGTPIVATDLLSTREAIDETQALFVTPDDPVAMSRGIEEALGDYGLSAQRAAAAWEKVQGCTWGARAEAVYNFICSD